MEKATKSLFHLWAAEADNYDDTKKIHDDKEDNLFVCICICRFVRVKVFAFAREKVPAFGFSSFSVEDCPGINGIYK